MTSLVFLLLMCASSFAQDADPAVLAEQVRLQNEMQRLAARETWEGVENIYLQLMELEKDGIVLSYAEHMLGAQSSRARGDVVATRERLMKAVALWETELAAGWLAEINQNFGMVTITVPPRRRTNFSVTASQVPFQADRRFAIEYANRIVNEDAQFEGMLPVGEYTIGTQTFVVSVDQPVSVDLLTQRRAPETATPEVASTQNTQNTSNPETANPETANPETANPEVAGTQNRGRSQGGASGPVASGAAGHVRVSGGFSMVGAAQGAGIEPLPFQGVSLGLALGGHYLLESGFGAGIELGGGLLPGADDSLRVMHVRPSVAMQRGRLLVNVGPVLSAGRATVTGLDSELLRQFCNELGEQYCSGLSEQPAQLETAVVQGTIRASGAGLGLELPVASTGSLQWAASLDVTSVTDGGRWYSWSHAGLVMRRGVGR